jgi:hypothetical protein
MFETYEISEFLEVLNFEEFQVSENFEIINKLKIWKQCFVGNHGYWTDFNSVCRDLTL